MFPQDGFWSNGIPTPSRLRPPSATITTPTARSAIENSAGRTLGSTSRHMIRRFFAPCARAAMTNSRCDHVSALARVIRPSTGVDTIPNAMISTTSAGMCDFAGSPRRNDANARARISAGTASITSNNVLMTRSTAPL